MPTGHTRAEVEHKIINMNIHCEDETCPAVGKPEIPVFDLVLNHWSSYCREYRRSDETSHDGPEMEDAVRYWKFTHPTPLMPQFRGKFHLFPPGHYKLMQEATIIQPIPVVVDGWYLENPSLSSSNTPLGTMRYIKDEGTLIQFVFDGYTRFLKHSRKFYLKGTLVAIVSHKIPVIDQSTTPPPLREEIDWEDPIGDIQKAGKVADEAGLSGWVDPSTGPNPVHLLPSSGTGKHGSNENPQPKGDRPKPNARVRGFSPKSIKCEHDISAAINPCPICHRKLLEDIAGNYQKFCAGLFKLAGLEEE